MNKRPILTAALVVALFSLIIVRFFPYLVFPSDEINDEKEYCIFSKIYKIEEKTYSYYYYAYVTEFPFRKIILEINKNSLKNWPKVRIGNILKCETTYKEFSVARNNGNFDEENYYHSLGISARYKVNNLDIYNSSVDWVADLAYRLKCHLTDSIQKLVGVSDVETAGTLSAMITGDKSGVTENIKSIYASSGISHILAISGLHISIIGMGIFNLLKKRGGYKWAAPISIVVVVFYCILSGMSPSAIRASVMLIIRIGAIGLGKKYDMLCSLSLAAILLLLENPFYLNNSGFQLSFSAILSLAIIPETLLKFFNIDSFEYSRKHKYRFKLLSGFLSSISVTLATLPIIVTTYYGYPFYGIIINMIIVPLVSYIVPDALLGSMVGIALPAIGQIIIGIGVYLIEFIDIICAFFSNLPIAYITTGSISEIRIAIYYIVVFLALSAIKVERIKKINLRIKLLALFLCLIILQLIIVINPLGNKVLHISFIDVDQGECILIESPAGYNYMIDCGSTGTKDVFKYRVKSTLKYYGVETIDYFFVSHPDTDHISGVIEMLEENDEIRINNLVIPQVEENEGYMTVTTLCISDEVSVINAVAGLRISDNYLEFKCISPDINEKSDDINDISAVWVLQYNNFIGLFTGDISSEQEISLLENGNVPSSVNLLDVAHHGSKYSSSSEFVNYCNPKISAISAGVDNAYGHPHREAIKRLESTGSNIYCTSQCGEIIINVSSDGTVKLDTYLK